MINTYPNKTTHAAFLLLSVNMFLTCGVIQKEKHSGEISAIRLKEVVQLVNLENMEVVDFGSNFDIIYYNDLVAYHISNSVYAIKEDDSQGVPDTLTFPYLVYKKGQSHGLLYDFLHSTEYRRIRVDSMLATMISVRDEMFLMDSLFYFVDSVRDQEAGLLEKYIPKIKKDESYPDSVYLYFKKDLLDVDFSLSGRLDKAKGMKFLEGRFIYLSAIDSASKKKIPRREISYQISRQSPANRENIVQFFERAKKNLEKPISAGQ